MTKLDSNFGASYHVIVKDSDDRIGVVSSHSDSGEANEAASNLKAALDATGNTKTDTHVVNGQADLASFVEKHNAIPVAVQTDNSGKREADATAALTDAPPADDKPKSSAKK